MALPLLLMLNTSRQLVFLRAFMAMKKRANTAQTHGQPVVSVSLLPLNTFKPWQPCLFLSVQFDIPLLKE